MHKSLGFDFVSQSHVAKVHTSFDVDVAVTEEYRTHTARTLRDSVSEVVSVHALITP